jgi:agmatinase
VDLVWPSPRTFFGAPSCPDIDSLDADVAFIGVPFDGGTFSPWIRNGQSQGPAAARFNSWNLFDYVWPPSAPTDGGCVGWYDINEEREYLKGVTMVDCGDIAIVGSQIEENLERIREVASRIVDRGALPVSVGGDHSISYPLIHAMESYKSVEIVQFDAHPDFFDDLLGARHSHGSFLRRANELGFIDGMNIIGLRNASYKLEVEEMLEHGVRWGTSQAVRREGAEAVVDRLVPESEHIYVTLDLDSLDAPYVPATTLPEPGGMTPDEVRDALFAVARKGKIVGFDVVELNPEHEGGFTTTRVALWLIQAMLSAMDETGQIRR